jgi:hypothetical protein
MAMVTCNTKGMAGVGHSLVLLLGVRLKVTILAF